MDFAASQHIDPAEFRAISEFIELHCGIHLTEEKNYLLRMRLTSLMVENGCRTFFELRNRAAADPTSRIRDRIIDAMTTNETLWFRDRQPFTILREVLFPWFSRQPGSGTGRRLRIWSAACSTGQEPYSIAMTFLDFCRATGRLRGDELDILAIDISPTVLFLAAAGRYDSIAMSRGIGEDEKTRYFEPDGKVWVLRDQVKRFVQFKRFNLQEPYSAMPKPNVIFCRNVLIYFSNEFKKEILRKMAALLRPDGYLFLGAAESIINYSSEFRMLRHNNGLYYQAI